MVAKKTTHSDAWRNVFGATLARFAGGGDSRGRSPLDALRKIPLLHRSAAGPVMMSPDPVSLAILAIDRVGPAAVRACASGVEVRVAAPDEATAAVLRAALAETARRRGTDRLIRIVVD